MYRIGILAGMGPRSTTPFLNAVLDECERQYGAQFDIDYPHMLIYSLPTPFFMDRPIVKQDMLETLEIGIEALTRADSAVIAVPCNSVHAYYHEMSAMTAIPILHIAEETIAQLTTSTNTVGLLGTRTTIESGLYQDRLFQHGKKIFWTEDFQRQVDQLLREVKQNGVAPSTLSLWRNIETLLIGQGIDQVISGCTDLYFCIEHSRLNVLDSSRALASSLVARYVREAL